MATKTATTMIQLIVIGSDTYTVRRVLGLEPDGVLVQFRWVKQNRVADADEGDGEYTVSVIEAVGPDCDCKGFIRFGMGCSDGRGCKHVRATKALLIQWAVPGWMDAFEGKAPAEQPDPNAARPHRKPAAKPRKQGHFAATNAEARKPR